MEKCFDYIQIVSLQVISNMSSTDHHINDRMQSVILTTLNEAHIKVTVRVVKTGILT
jgi:hypothetical protein